jgi:hypothetical protein
MMMVFEPQECVRAVPATLSLTDWWACWTVSLSRWARLTGLPEFDSSACVSVALESGVSRYGGVGASNFGRARTVFIGKRFGALARFCLGMLVEG